MSRKTLGIILILVMALALVGGLYLMRPEGGETQAPTGTGCDASGLQTGSSSCGEKSLPENEAAPVSTSDPHASEPQLEVVPDERDQAVPRAGTGSSPAEKMDSERFAVLTDKVLRELPKVGDLQGLSEEETHGAPGAVRRAGASLGEIAEALDANPELAPQALEFYRGCATQSEGLKSVRALCLSNYQALADESGREPDPEVMGTMPQSVKDLAQGLEDLE